MTYGEGLPRVSGSGRMSSSSDASTSGGGWIPLQWAQCMRQCVQYIEAAVAPPPAEPAATCTVVTDAESLEEVAIWSGPGGGGAPQQGGQLQGWAATVQQSIRSAAAGLAVVPAKGDGMQLLPRTNQHAAYLDRAAEEERLQRTTTDGSLQGYPPCNDYMCMALV